MAVEGNANEEARFTPPLERFRVVVPDRAQPCRTEGFSRQQLKRLENCAQRDDGFVQRVRTKKQTNII